MRGRIRIREQLPVAISAAAVLFSLAALSPAGEAASNTVRAALFATDAGSVNRIRVSRTPKAGQLLPLNREGRFPRSVIPPTVGETGPPGAAGPRGPQGPEGRAGGYTVFTANPIGRQISPVGDDVTRVGWLDDLPAGSWLLLGTAITLGTDSGQPVTCSIANGNRVLGASTATTGRNPSGGQRMIGQHAIAGFTAQQPTPIDYQCALGRTTKAQFDAGAVYLSAIRVGSLEVRKQGP